MPAPVLAPALQPGATVAVVSTSWQGIAVLPERAARAVAAVESLGHPVRLMPHAAAAGDGVRDWVAGPPADRAADLHAAFADPDVGLVLSAIGGNHSGQLLEYLDFDLIAAHPKPFCGYSDTTTMLHAIHARTGLVTIYGPALLPEFGEIGGPDAEVVDWLLRIVCDPTTPGALPRVGWQASEDRAATDAEGRARRRIRGEPRTVLRSGVGSGPLLPGCLPILRNLADTGYEPEYAGRILLVEPPEPPYDPELADADLTWLRTSGRLEDLAGLVLARSDGWAATAVEQWHRCALDAARGYRYPVLAGVETGHPAPMLAVPVGAPGRIEGEDLIIEGPAVVEASPQLRLRRGR